MTILARSKENHEKKEYSPRDDTYAVITPEQKILGRIKEVYTTGIAFNYIDESQNTSRSQAIENCHHKIDIFIKQRGYFLKDLPIQRLTNSAISNTPTFSQLPLRQIKVEFGELNNAQIRKLEYLIRHYDAYEGY